MKITAITMQKRDNNRVNISVDGKYRFSLDSYQLIDLGLKIGREYDDSELILLEQESQYGKVYGRALEYCLMRPHSAREVRNYLFRKTRATRDKTGSLKSGVSPDITERVYNRLEEKGYIDDQKFAHHWVENRSINKGVSRRKLVAELYAKGVDNEIVEHVLGETQRNDESEIQKIIAKKRPRYPDEQKLIAYLARQGFGYDEIKHALASSD